MNEFKKKKDNSSTFEKGTQKGNRWMKMGIYATKVATKVPEIQYQEINSLVCYRELTVTI